MPDMAFLAFLVVDGALAGAIYALVALAFVVVYKASRMINFAMGEWITLGSRMVASGIHVFGLGLGGALGFACVGMVAVAMAFNRVVLRRLFSRSLLSLIMVTIGLGIFMRGAAALVFAGIPGGIARPLPLDPVVIQGVPVSPLASTRRPRRIPVSGELRVSTIGVSAARRTPTSGASGSPTGVVRPAAT